MRRIAGTAAFALAFTLLGCGGIFEPSGTDLTVSLDDARASGADVTLSALILNRRVNVRATSGVSGARAERSVRGPRLGVVPVDVVLLTPEGDTLAAVSFAQVFRPNHQHWVYALVGSRRPLGHCIGQLAVSPLRAGGADTMFVMYGSLPDDAIC